MIGAIAAIAAAKVIGDMVNSGRSLPTPDLTNLFNTISQAGDYQKDLINQLPENLKPLYAQYQSSLGKAGEGLKTSTTDIGQDLLKQTKSLYGPDSDVVKATLAGLKEQDYSTLPGTLTNLKAQLAATGGLARGGAGKAITEAVLAPAQAYSGQAQTVMAQQLQAQQLNVQQALNTIAKLDDATANALFGMSTAEAANILSYGRSDLQDQLANLINQSTQETNQKLAAQGIQTNAAYQNAVTRNAQQSQLTNDITGVVGGLVGNALTTTPTSGGSSSVPAGADVTSMDYMRNALANAPK